MPHRPPQSDSSSDLLAALRFLLQARNRTPKCVLLLRARLCGLVISSPGADWKADGDSALRLLRVAIKKLPSDASALAPIIAGIGEIGARSSADLSEPIIPYLRSRRHRVDFVAILNVIAKGGARVHKRFQLDAVALAQLIATAHLNWMTFQNAIHRLQRPFDCAGGSNWGLQLAIRIALYVDPKAIDGWIATRPNEQVIAAVGRVVIDRLVFDSNSGLAPALLRSRSAAIRSLAAAALIWPVFPRDREWSFAICWRMLMEGGLPAEVAMWMIGSRLKEAIHARYRLEDGMEKNNARFHYLERNPKAAMGGAHNANAEIGMLKRNLESFSKSYPELLNTIETLLSGMAANWPLSGLSEEQMANLENIFVSTAEIRYRLGEKLPHPANSAWLLKRNIRQFKDQVGLSVPIDQALSEYFHPHDQSFGPLCVWTARSLHLLYANDARGVGKRTSDIVNDMAAAASKLIDQPFAASRQPVRCQSAVARAVCCDLLALKVVAEADSTKRASVQVLGKLAAEHSFTLFTDTPDLLDSFFDQMATLTMNIVASDASLAHLRAKWISSEDMQPFPRAVALWSDTHSIRQHLDLAISLFRRVAEPPLSLRSRDRQLSRLLTLLDIAVAANSQNQDHDLAETIIGIWDLAFADWSQYTGGRWADSARELHAAVQRDGPERAAFLNDPIFKQSNCRNVITAASTPAAQEHF